jgi:hypothetical protein
MLKSSQSAWRPAPRTAKVVSLSVLVALGVVVSSARGVDEPPEENVFRDNTEQVVRSAATLAGAGCQGGNGTTMVLALLLRGEQQHLWKLEASDQALPLSPALLKRVKDSADIRIDDAAFESEAYCEALFKASLVSLGAFSNSAHDATFAELFTDPRRYRGEVIHYEGKVRHIRRLDAPLMLAGKGIKDVYECWIFGADDGANPVCLVCTELPDGVKPGKQPNIPAAFDAYFFKRYRYQAVDSKPGQAREAPLFIGRSFVVRRVEHPPPDSTNASYADGSHTLLVIFLGGVFTTVVLAFVMHWWFRRSDRLVQKKIREVRTHELTDPGAPSLPPAPSANLIEAQTECLSDKLPSPRDSGERGRG